MPLAVSLFFLYPHKSGRKSEPMSTQHILIIDDEPTISGMLNEALKRQKYEVETANNGQEAIEFLAASQYDLVITDLYLPDINGIEILKTAKNNDPDVGVIIITADSSIETAVEAMRVGAYDYLTKGFTLGEIEVTVEKFFQYQTLVKENQQLRTELGGRYGIKNIIGKSPKMQKLFEAIE